MRKSNKKSFFEKLTGAINVEDNEFEENEYEEEDDEVKEDNWIEEDNEEGQLTVDVYQTGDDIIIQTMVAGVRPDDLNITITRDMVTIKGTRTRENSVSEDDYFFNELYWGSFSRKILLPQEVDPEEAEAVEKNGLLRLRLPKIDKERKKQITVKSV